jgi:hypothetical protein
MKQKCLYYQPAMLSIFNMKIDVLIMEQSVGLLKDTQLEIHGKNKLQSQIKLIIESLI